MPRGDAQCGLGWAVAVNGQIFKSLTRRPWPNTLITRRGWVPWPVHPLQPALTADTGHRPLPPPQDPAASRNGGVFPSPTCPGTGALRAAPSRAPLVGGCSPRSGSRPQAQCGNRLRGALPTITERDEWYRPRPAGQGPGVGAGARPLPSAAARTPGAWGPKNVWERATAAGGGGPGASAQTTSGRGSCPGLGQTGPRSPAGSARRGLQDPAREDPAPPRPSGPPPRPLPAQAGLARPWPEPKGGDGAGALRVGLARLGFSFRCYFCQSNVCTQREHHRAPRSTRGFPRRSGPRRRAPCPRPHPAPLPVRVPGPTPPPSFTATLRAATSRVLRVCAWIVGLCPRGRRLLRAHSGSGAAAMRSPSQWAWRLGWFSFPPILSKKKRVSRLPAAAPPPGPPPPPPAPAPWPHPAQRGRPGGLPSWRPGAPMPSSVRFPGLLGVLQGPAWDKRTHG